MRSSGSRRPAALVLALATIIVAWFGISGCERVKREVILATTTSTRDTGLLDVLIPAFERRHPYKVKVVAVGSGQALALGKEGNADVLLTHAPSSEKPLVQEGYVVNRRLVMHNDFVFVGPAGDPAGIAGQATAVDVMKAIAAKGSTFVSRGDDSGTHKTELALWASAGVTPRGQRWYQETGQPMGQTLTVASEKSAYALADRGTYLARRATMGLRLLFAGDPALLNIYHVMEVSGQRFPKVNAEGGKAFADFLLSKEVQDMIRVFGLDLYGEPCFFADGGLTEEQLLSRKP